MRTINIDITSIVFRDTFATLAFVLILCAAVPLILSISAVLIIVTDPLREDTLSCGVALDRTR